MRVAAAPTCPLGFTEHDVPPGTELPAAWRAPRASPSDRPHAPAQPAGAQTGPGRREALPSALVRPGRPERTRPLFLACRPELVRPPELGVEVTPAAEALFVHAGHRARAVAEARRLEFRSQLLPAIYFGLLCGLAAAAPRLPAPLLALAAAAAGVAGACSYQTFGAAPNRRAGDGLMAQGAWRAAEAALSWAYDDGEALRQLAEARRRQGDWDGATTALLRWQPQDGTSAKLWALQLDAVAAHELDALSPPRGAGEPRRRSRSPDGAPRATRSQVRWSTPNDAT